MWQRIREDRSDYDPALWQNNVSKMETMAPKMSIRYITDLVVFARVVDSKGLSAAARQLGLTKSAVSKQLTRLEKAVGARLIARTTRRISLTEAGAAVYECSVRIIEEATAVDLALAGLQTNPKGSLRVSTSVAFGNLHLTALLPGFQKRYPDVKIYLGLNDRYVDIAEEGFDVVIRLTSQPGPNHVARPLAPIRYVICATPEYLEEHKAPETPDDLENHNCLLYGYLTSNSQWNFIGPHGKEKVKVAGNLTVNSSESLREAVVRSAGVALLPTYAVGEDIRQGRLIRLLTRYRPIGMFGDHVFAIYLQNRFLAPKVRVFIDYLVEVFGNSPYWDRDVFDSSTP